MSIQRKPTQLTWRDLPVSDGVPMDNQNHVFQAAIYLIMPLQRLLAERGTQAFVGSNSFVYYQTEPAKAKGPDFYVVNGGLPAGQGSWVVPAENGLYPTLVGELLSPSTEQKDRTTKKDFYQNVFKSPDYFIYDTENQRFEAWHLVQGVYRPVTALANGRIPCQSLPLHLGVVGKWLRWFTPEGELVLTDDELADAERRRADAAQQRADAAQKRADSEQQRAEAAERAVQRALAALLASGMDQGTARKTLGLADESR
jgi:Uma2 family endonuclease